MIKDGDKFANAETEIDYKKKTIEFNYNNKNYNKKYEKLAFFYHGYYTTISVPLVIMSIWTAMVFNTGFIGIYPEYYFGETVMFFTSAMISVLLPIMVMGTLSIIVHKNSKIARKNFPVSNVALSPKGKWLKIDLAEKREVYPEGFKYHKKFIHTNYCIGRFEYNYIGDNKLLKVYTRSREEDNKRGEHFRYVCIFEFAKPIKDGVLLWR